MRFVLKKKFKKYSRVLCIKFYFNYSKKKFYFKYLLDEK